MRINSGEIQPEYKIENHAFNQTNHKNQRSDNGGWVVATVHKYHCTAGIESESSLFRITVRTAGFSDVA